MSIVFRNKEGQAIKTWVNVEYAGHGIPMAGDIVILHWGDYGEDEEAHIVCQRVFDGRETDKVFLVVEPYDVEGVH